MGKSRQARRKAEKEWQRREGQLITITWQTEIIRVNKHWQDFKHQEDKERQEIEQETTQAMKKLISIRQDKDE